MKRILLFALFLTGSVLFCSAQTNADHSNFVPASSMKSKKTLVSDKEKTGVDPSTDKNKSSDLSKSGNETESKSQTQVKTQYLEYTVDQGSNTNPVENPADNQMVTVPIQAEGYTDPNYEVNKQKSAGTV